MDARETIRGVLRLCYYEKETLRSGKDRSSKVYELYEEHLRALQELAERTKEDKELAKEALEALVEALLDYPVWCSFIVDSGLRDNIKDVDDRLAKVALFLMKREFSDEAVEYLMQFHKGKALLAGRIEERIKNAILRRLDGSTFVKDEIPELERLLSVAERLKGYIDKRILERRKRIVECISRRSFLTARS